MRHLVGEYKNDGTLYGGKIEDYDFDSSKPKWISNIAERIRSDEVFDKQCKRNIEERNRRIKKE